MNYVALSSHVTSVIDSGCLGMSKGARMGTVGGAGDRRMNNIVLFISYFRSSDYQEFPLSSEAMPINSARKQELNKETFSSLPLYLPLLKPQYQ